MEPETKRGLWMLERATRMMGRQDRQVVTADEATTDGGIVASDGALTVLVDLDDGDPSGSIEQGPTTDEASKAGAVETDGS
jgi:hypothetical protein